MKAKVVRNVQIDYANVVYGYVVDQRRSHDILEAIPGVSTKGKAVRGAPQKEETRPAVRRRAAVCNAFSPACDGAEDVCRLCGREENSAATW